MNANPPLSVVWTTPTSSFETRASNVDEAIEVIREAGANPSSCPTMVEFFSEESGLALAIGVGRAVSVLTFQGSCDPPYYISLGVSDAKGVGEFCYGNEPTEYLARNLIPQADAIEAVKWFIQHRSRPLTVNWKRL